MKKKIIIGAIIWMSLVETSNASSLKGSTVSFSPPVATHNSSVRVSEVTLTNKSELPIEFQAWVSELVFVPCTQIEMSADESIAQQCNELNNKLGAVQGIGINTSRRTHDVIMPSPRMTLEALEKGKFRVIRKVEITQKARVFDVNIAEILSQKQVDAVDEYQKSTGFKVNLAKKFSPVVKWVPDGATATITTQCVSNMVVATNIGNDVAMITDRETGAFVGRVLPGGTNALFFPCDRTFNVNNPNPTK